MLPLLLFALLVITVRAVPLTANVVNNGITKDAPFSVSQAQLNSLPLVCPYGVQRTAGKTILFIHGTGGTGDESWAPGLVPAFLAQGWVAFFTMARKGRYKANLPIYRFYGCYVNLPNRTLGDAQVTSEYVVSAIQRLYQQTGKKQIALVGHSQGNLNIQWALNYWPSTRSMVANYVSLSGDFQGTGEGPILQAVQDLAVRGTSPSVIQQSVLLGQQSNYLKALNKRGNLALVPTTSTYGLEDEIIQPVAPDTMLGSGGAAFVHVAVEDICPTFVVDHFAILIDSVAFYLALDAFTHGGVASVARVRAAYPDICSNAVAPGVSSTAVPDDAKEAFLEALAVGTEGVGTQGGPLSQRALVEPPLMPYALK